jgi:hypothetical protein
MSSSPYPLTALFAILEGPPFGVKADLPPVAGFDGELLHVVPANEEELKRAERWAEDPARDDERGRIIDTQRVAQRTHSYYSVYYSQFGL